jgi:Flp pilus assembly pilin Flp
LIHVDTPSEQGQISAEYAVVLAVIGTGVVATVALLNGAIVALFHSALAAFR